MGRLAAGPRFRRFSGPWQHETADAGNQIPRLIDFGSYGGHTAYDRTKYGRINSCQSLVRYGQKAVYGTAFSVRYGYGVKP